MPLDGMNNLELPEHLNFEVELIKASDVVGTGFKVGPKVYAVHRKHDGLIYKFVSDRYQIVPYATSWQAMIDTCEEATLDLADVDIKHSDINSSGRWSAYLSFRTEIIEPRVGDIHSYGVNVGSSYDQSAPHSITSLANRWWCDNGCYTGEHTYKSSRKHTTNISIEKEVIKLKNGVQAFYDSEVTYKEWMQQHVGYDDAEHLFGNTIASYPYRNRIKTNEKLLTSLLADFQRSVSDMGANAWNAYNVATAWATHTEPSRGGTKLVTQERNATKVATMLNSKEWKELVDA